MSNDVSLRSFLHDPELNCEGTMAELVLSPMGLPLVRKRFTPADYYQLERDATYKSDFYEGEIYDMSGGTSQHSLITMNLGAALWQALRGRPCKAYESNMRVAVLKTGLRTYPDVSIYCGEMEFDPEDPGRTTATNPTVVFEVLPSSTERYDRGTKSEHYRLIETLAAYLLIAQDEAKVELFARDGAVWKSTTVVGLEQSITIPGPDVTIALADIYDGIDFTA